MIPDKELLDDVKITRYAQLALRVLGVMFLVEGASGVVGSLMYAAMQMSAYKEAGYEPFPDYYVVGWLASSLALLVAGGYFAVGGAWVFEKVFLPSSKHPEAGYEDEADGFPG